ncbi:coiled-coil domain-containing protein 102A-like isoform X2 [Pomacea canaliculata]|uniref:coiled-coil domain-containing protein 102A-like isoform X2 n=1 Tax=Pomacea canaliculata TaxID=400727 RepID=UPI000D73CF67|nr:coiled-coil domain-containing protein 102A-like isoform X2 [Pomacea canaliculata]
MAVRNADPVNVGISEREELLMRELEEARVRVAQMEKTMRWWSDCTANWRDKWNKARNERNKAREENRMLRARLDALVKECTSLKRAQREKLSAEIEIPIKSPLADSSKDQLNESVEHGKNESKDSVSSDVLIAKAEKEKSEKDVEEKDTDELDSVSLEERLRKKSDDGAGRQQDLVAKLDVHYEEADENANSSRPSSEALSFEQASQLQLQLDEAQKTIQSQKYEKDTLSRTIEQLEGELSSLRVKCDEIKQSKQELLQQLTKLREDHENEMGRLTLDLEDESLRTSSMDRRLTELRRELERLQAENAAEWGKRERLESEKQSLERENRKLRSAVADLEEQLQRKHQQAAASVDGDLRALQFDLAEKNKELTELRHTHSKLRKTLGERITELEHTRRRADQYEAEVKKLRGRVEELKRDLATAEDEIDVQANMSRRLQRTNDELQEQVDNLTVQVDHLENRLRRGSQSIPKTRSSSLKSFTMEDSAELADSEDDIEET